MLFYYISHLWHFCVEGGTSPTAIERVTYVHGWGRGEGRRQNDKYIRVACPDLTLGYHILTSGLGWDWMPRPNKKFLDWPQETRATPSQSWVRARGTSAAMGIKVRNKKICMQQCIVILIKKVWNRLPDISTREATKRPDMFFFLLNRTHYVQYHMLKMNCLGSPPRDKNKKTKGSHKTVYIDKKTCFYSTSAW